MSPIKLQYPVTIDGKTYDALTLRRPRAKDLAAADMVEGQTSKSFAIYASLAGVPLGVIRELDLADLTVLAAQAEEVLGNVPAPAGAA